MPELPEVQTIVNELSQLDIEGQQVKKVFVFWPGSIASDLKNFIEDLEKETILSIGRRGKFIIFTLRNFTLLVHLRMTGKFIVSEDPSQVIHERIQLQLSNGLILHFADQRKFGKWYLLSDPKKKLDELGIEPLSEEFTLAVFKQLLSRSTCQLKSFLLNQKYITGLGNIYVDEALWEAKLSPTRKANALNEEEIQALFVAIPHVLKGGVANMGTSLGSKNANYFSVSRRRGMHQNHLKVFRRDGLSCPRCQSTIIKSRVANRGTHHCPFCQH